MSKFMLLLLLIDINLNNVLVYGYSSGAPNNRKVCTSLIPGHGSKQDTPSPYKLTSVPIDDKSVGLDLVATLQVTFTGFIVQARDLNDPNQIIDGSFTQTSENTHTKSCLTTVQNTWTHENGEPKTKVSSQWIPPEHFNGSIFFLTTVVQVKQAYWDQIKSNPVYFINGKITDEDNFTENIGKKEANFLNGDAPKLAGLNYNDCDNKMCIGLGEETECFSNKSCQALLTVFKNDLQENEFQIHAKPSANLNNIYYSMGLSDDDKMGDDFVVDCFVDSTGKVRVGLSHNDGKSNDPLTNMDPLILSHTSGQYLDGFVLCKWKLKEKFQIKNKEYDLQNNYHIFMASGNLENDEGFKEYHDLKIKTPEPVSLASTGSIQFKDLNFLIRIHGSLMLIAWLGAVPVAITLARYFKNAWSGKLLCGVQLWFAFHRSLMVISICLMIIAQVCIFYYVGEYRMGLHQILGSIAFVLALFQPIGALFRPHPSSSKRWLFNWMHWLGGTVGHICATAAIFLATKLKLANLPDAFLYVAIVWTLCHVVLHLIFQFYSFCISDSKTPDIAMHNMRQREIYEENKTRKNSFKYFLLTFYIILILFLMSVLVVFVTAPNIVKDLL